uniref:Uncharacterized protein n=1 Tax=Esox lucius TaxID=8010 RepID=A0A3P8YVW8_ESOLU
GTETGGPATLWPYPFAHRFSLQDPEYQQYVSRPANPPPLVEDWRGRGGGHNRGGSTSLTLLSVAAPKSHQSSNRKFARYKAMCNVCYSVLEQGS